MTVTLNLDALGWSRRRDPRLFAELPLSAPNAPREARAGEGLPEIFIDLPRLRHNPVERQAGKASQSSTHHPPDPSDCEPAFGPADDTATSLDPSNVAETCASPAFDVGGRGAFPASLPPDGYLAAIEALAALGAGTAGVVAALECRREQIEQWGHTPAKDREQKIAGFLDRITNAIARDAHGAREHHQARTGLEPVRKYLVKTAALCLAAIDRIDAEPQRDDHQQGD